LEVPHRPRAHLIATAAGPAANLLICLAAGLALQWATDFTCRPPWNPLWYPYRVPGGDGTALTELIRWDGQTQPWNTWAAALPARVFWLNWVLFLLNVALVGFPMDGGRLLQCALWPRFGFRQATMYAIFAGFLTMLAVGIFAVVRDEVMPLCLALFIYFTCRQQWILLETGGEESVFGYDFSQGYTSLEGAPPTARRRRTVSPWQRWLQRRAARRLQREQDQREAEERRMDELLQKVQLQGLPALTDEERRFLTRVSDRYKRRG
jgi:hypothetical protein